MTRKSNSGRRLLREWKIPARQAFYHRGGRFYMPLSQFPGALCDPHGYVVFISREDYERSPNLSIGPRLNIRHGVISDMSGYRRIV